MGMLTKRETLSHGLPEVAPALSITRHRGSQSAAVDHGLYHGVVALSHGGAIHIAQRPANCRVVQRVQYGAITRHWRS
jgi:hypothetical protein